MRQLPEWLRLNSRGSRYFDDRLDEKTSLCVPCHSGRMTAALRCWMPCNDEPAALSLQPAGISRVNPSTDSGDAIVTVRLVAS